jgi:hypothetical protein
VGRRQREFSGGVAESLRFRAEVFRSGWLSADFPRGPLLQATAFMPDVQRGSVFGAWFLGLYGLLEIIPGCIHVLLPDGGAEVIAGLDLTHNRHTVIGTVAWMGSLQIAHGIGLMAIAWRCRELVPLFLGLALLERVLMTLTAWVTKPNPAGHHPPEHYGSLILVPVLAAVLVLSLRTGTSSVDAR